jgi:AcrR family transcriptional regulator
MPQVLKPEMRARILEAALEVFASDGYSGATMAVIGERAGVGAASVYRYYPNKSSLFEAALPAHIADALRDLLARRVRALAGARPGGPDPTGEEMLRFWIEHRLAVVILLDRAEGTPYTSFGARFVDSLVELTIERLRAADPRLRMGAPERFVLRRIFENTRAMLASILAEHAGENEIREAVGAFWSYQIAGLRGFAAHVSKEGRASRLRPARSPPAGA